jgi:hypothetical protein
MSMATRFDALLDVIAQGWRAAWRWLRRRFGRGTLPPVYETKQGHVVPRVEQVPVRSTKADGKRQALAYARQRTGNPTLTWGQARKLMKRWLREERLAGSLTPEMACAMEESE